jgi:hypothetical protein
MLTRISLFPENPATHLNAGVCPFCVLSGVILSALLVSTFVQVYYGHTLDTKIPANLLWPNIRRVGGSSMISPSGLHDQNVLFNKLPEFIRKAVLEDQRDRISVKELNELIRLKIDETKGLNPSRPASSVDQRILELGKNFMMLMLMRGLFPIYGIVQAGPAR